MPLHILHFLIYCVIIREFMGVVSNGAHRAWHRSAPQRFVVQADHAGTGLVVACRAAYIKLMSVDRVREYGP